MLPRAFFVSNIEVIPEAEAAWARLHDGDFDPAVTAFFDSQHDELSVPIDSGSVTSATLVSHLPREIVFDVETDADRWLVVSEVYYPAGWTATVDDQPASIERADYLLRAVHVPEGRHRVRMQFQPAAHIWGVRLSLLSTIIVYGGLAALLVPGWVRRRRDRPGEPSE
jgi:hypothetical protein